MDSLHCSVVTYNCYHIYVPEVTITSCLQGKFKAVPKELDELALWRFVLQIWQISGLDYIQTMDIIHDQTEKKITFLLVLAVTKGG